MANNPGADPFDDFLEQILVLSMYEVADNNLVGNDAASLAGAPASMMLQLGLGDGSKSGTENTVAADLYSVAPSHRPWSYDSLKNFRQISPTVQTHLSRGSTRERTLSLITKDFTRKEEMRIDKEYDVVFVPSDGVCLSGSESDWSVGCHYSH
ncbi:unnamed protein product [Fraxinus pennsylvanica]|uniref:Uncharacterized protein n=1 Tax=Fraxinus pennsylvanica TaxID=56036 RepID=A0AAD1YUP6_9LAMI|nr:unnamed protein product [Fraxinus pennsylvanica]